MEEEFTAVVPCSSLAVDSVLRFAAAGVFWGFCSAPYDARKRGKVCWKIRLPKWTCCRCIRHNSLWTSEIPEAERPLNTLIAGAIAGAAVAAQTRNLNNIIGVACLVSAFSVAADHISRAN
ncbi:hypothetical protein ERO13_A12G130300v2 [Gossypium hirsutum]|uniref:Outer envelope pore protein 16-4, chloroplastic isoform X2 n=1 Tax=Gossypium hirsutum TaxID=3635 RepID=A0A1U8LYR2_GOSHI|nr:outer envelope pore protein 16-4, chloroplastic-like isoform X2 [Gossypium hirsutum]KAG4170157.1 hypothetical protein ERO13_A12G130300v2 [Gossypium hirsutum]